MITVCIMSQFEIPCEFDKCKWKSVLCDPATAAKFLDAHIKAKHSVVEQKPVLSGAASKSRAERAKRPEIRSEETDEDWAYICKRWGQYKAQCELTGTEVVLQLLECCSEQLRRDHHRQHPGTDIDTITETELLGQLKKLAVRQQNKMVARVKLSSLTQDKGEGVRRFAGRVRELANTGGYTVQCGDCKRDVDFTTEMVKCQVVTGMANHTHQRDVLAHPEGNTITLDKLLVYIEGKEQAERSQGLLAGSGFEAKKVDTEKAPGGSGAIKKMITNCRWCGDKHQAGKANCKAADKQCDHCGKHGHLKKVCRKKQEEDKVTTDTKVKVVEDSSKQQENAVDAHWLEQSQNRTFYGTNKLVNLYLLVVFIFVRVVVITCTRLAFSRKEVEFPNPTKPLTSTGALIPIRPERRKVPGLLGHGKGSRLVNSSVRAAHSYPSPVASCTGKGRTLSHHIYRQGSGWLRQPAMAKPMVMIRSELDKESYTAHQVGEPPVNSEVAQEKFLADTGASVCLAGTKYMRALGIKQEDLLKTDMCVRGAGNQKIEVLGVLLVSLSQPGSSSHSKQMVYICEGVTGPLLSLEACQDLGLVDQDFPRQPPTITVSLSQQGKESGCKCGCPVREVAPDAPAEIPFEPIPANVPKLEQWIRDRYAASALNVCECQPLPAMHGPPLKIFMEPGTKPVASHSPIPVPIHWQQKVLDGLERDVRLGVIERVPPGTETTWCHRMVIVPKKDGKPRRTVNFQPLNQYSSRQTHHTMSPFHQATSIPANTVKTVLDAWNGYHSVALEESCRHLTTFITPWGRFRYCTAPMGYLAAGDAYTDRFDRIIKDIQNKTKIVDDTALWASNVRESFHQTCEFLTLCSRNGIVFNPDKFVFARETVEFAGFEVGKNHIKPAKKIIDNIMAFPVPKTISDVRGWFGLVNQVAPFFASRPIMQPFREMLKPSAKGKGIYWDDNLTKLFAESKQVIAQSIADGIRTYDPNRWTCLATDWSKEGIGYTLTQKHCLCQTLTPLCCQEGWKLVLAGSRFTSGAESRYAPVEGEALGVSWALENTRHFTMGNSKLIVATDHKPLLKILGDRKLEDMSNPRLLKLKERTLRWNFSVIHVPGIRNCGPDYLSRKETRVSMVQMFSKSTTRVEEVATMELETWVEQCVAANLVGPVTWEQVRDAVQVDSLMQLLSSQVSDGFPPEKKLLREELKMFWQFRDHLSQVDGVPLYKGRVVVPEQLRAAVLDVLHSAHQGVTGMLLRADTAVWWPGITAQVREKRQKCRTCNEFAPTQPRAPPAPLVHPEYPFQHIVADHCQAAGHHYLVIADRFSGWPTILECGSSIASAGKLIAQLRVFFGTFGVPEELATDGGVTFTAEETKQFLARYGIHHRISSVGYPHSNQRAELAVKSMKRLLRDNVTTGGSLDTDRLLRAIMAYRNTPDRDTGCSPAQVLFGRELRDFLPSPVKRYSVRPEWRIQAQEREQALAKRGAKNMDGLQHRSKVLPRLAVGMLVQIQNQVGNHPTRWDNTGVVVEVKDHDQYVIKVHGTGRLTVRNRQFLRHVSVGLEDIVQMPASAPYGPPGKVVDHGHHSPGNGQEVPDASPSEGGQLEVPERGLVAPQQRLDDLGREQDDQVQVRRSNRRQTPVDRLQPSWGTKSYAEAVQQQATPVYSVSPHQDLLHTQAGGGGGHHWGLAQP